MGDAGKEKWNTEKMREHRNDWSLAADIQLFSYMQQFSQNLLGETHTTLKALDSLESEVATTCVEVSNIGNRFWALSDTQFVENRVYDDDDVSSPVAQTPQDILLEDSETVVVQRLKQAIENGIQVLDSKFETVQVPASDSDEDDSSPHSGVVLKPVNRYKDRRLPHLIGSVEFRADDSLGLRDGLSDEDTEDLMSGSDKADESDNSDVDSDLTKELDLPQKDNNIFSALMIPAVEHIKADSNISSPPSGEIFGEQEDDLFSHNKPIFSNWKPTDLWATEDENEKGLGDDSSNNRPPSAASSISSAQSSNISEPVKKMNQEFGKSGTGRQPVLVQEDQEDLFGSKTAAVMPPQTKEYVPAGGVKIFAGDFDPNSIINSARVSNREVVSSAAGQMRPRQKDDEDDIFVKKQEISTKVAPQVPTLHAFREKKKDDVKLFDDEEEDLFSNRSDDSQNKSQPSSTTMYTARSDLEDDNLFSDSSIYSDSRTHSFFENDLFDNENDNLFSSIDKSEKLIKSGKAAVPQKSNEESFPGHGLSKQCDEPRGSVLSHKNKAPSIFDKDLFSDETDLFKDVANVKSDDLFGVPSFQKKSNISVSKEQRKTSVTPKPLKKDLFDDSEDDDALFGNTSKIPQPSQKNTVHQDFNVSENNKSSTFKQEAVADDLFGPLRASTETQGQHVKGKLPVLKLKKGLERRSLFDSDSDDDLFSSPQGSLSSRKSVQSANAPTMPSEHEDKKKLSSLNKDSDIPKLPKTDFSSIFSNDNDDESNDLVTGNKAISSTNIFGEDKDLFPSSNTVVKTPDLFNNPILKPLVKEPLKDSSSALNELEDKVRLESRREAKKSEIVVEAINEQITEATNKLPVSAVSLETDIFCDSPPEDDGKLDINKKPEPPKSLDIKPILETLPSKPQRFEEKDDSEKLRKPPVSKKPLPKVLVENPLVKDVPDGEIITPPSPSKTVPGKLKASQLLNINTAALLPGARPSKSDTQIATVPERGDKTETATSVTGLPPHTSTSQPSLSTQYTSDLPPASSTLLQSVNKERVKIQGRRRPPSRRARQEAIRASSVEMESESSILPPATSVSAPTLISPSTDEEDLFGVPPLDVVYDVKTKSPSTDIFGSPTVLSPITNKEVPSSFVSTPFVHSQPPPLDEEQEEGSNQEDDLFAPHSNLLGNLSADKYPIEVKSEIPKKESLADDIFGDLEDDSLFHGIREAPPPLVDDDDDDEDDDYDGLFFTRKKKENTSSKISHSSSVVATLESLPKEDSLFFTPPESTVSITSYDTSVPSKSTDLENDFLFSTKDSVKSNDNLFPLQKEHAEEVSDDSLFTKTVEHSKIVTEDTLFPAYAGSDKEDTLFNKHIKSAKVTSNKPLLFTPDQPLVEPLSTNSDEELFGSHSKLNKSKTDKVPGSSSSLKPIQSDQSQTVKNTDGILKKRETLFGDDEEEEAGNLFSSVMEKKIKAKPNPKSSLFGEDDDDDDDIFGSASLLKKRDREPKPTATNPEITKGSSQKSTKPGGLASSKPVKLETKQTFFDPLLSHEDKE